MSLGTHTFAKLQNPIGVYNLCQWDLFIINKKEQPNKAALYQYEDFRVNKYIVPKNNQGQLVYTSLKKYTRFRVY